MISRQEPFPDHIDTTSFYDGGSRRDIVEHITSALSEDVALITLTGTDGSGKTMVCRMVREELPGDQEVLFFEQGVESFDEVVNRLAAQVGQGELEEISDRKALLDRTIELLSDSDRRLIIIIDSAENIFLATLERIRRMLDEVNADRFCVQLILSGRPLLALNYKQLAIIAFKPAEEKHLSLDPLDGEQTFNYLNHCLERAGFTEKERFTRTQAENIADVARGNFRLINQLGGRYFDPEREVDLDEAEIEELYNGVSAVREDGAYEKISAGLKNVDLDFLKVPQLGMRWYVAGGGLILFILLLFLLLRGGEEETGTLPGAVDVPELTLEKVEPDPIELPEPSIVQVPAAEIAAEQTTAAPLKDVPLPGSVDVPELTLEKVEPDPMELPESSTVRAPAAEIVAEQTSAAPLEDVPLPIEDEKPGDAAVAGPDPGNKPVQEKTVVPEPAALAREKKPIERPGQEPDSPIVVETAAADAEEPSVATGALEEESPAAAEKQIVGKEPTRTENETEPEADSTQSVVATPDSQAPETETTPAVADASADEPVAALPRENQPEPAVPAVVPPEPAEEADKTVAEGSVTSGAETLRVPQLSVLPRKQPSTEAVPFNVVTLSQESKRKPEETAAQASAQTEPEDPDSSSQPPAARQSRERAEPEITETVQPEIQPAEAVPSRVVGDRTAVQPAQKSRTPARNPDNYYAERLAAGSRWLVGGSSRKYTVQLMVLNAEDAQDNVREMLVEDGYQSIVDDLYILRKSGQPQTVMLYYGEFDSSAEARQAKAQLPSFLNRLEPYELAVKEAVAKARAVQ